MSTIEVGDGSEVGVAIATLLAVVTILPVAAVWGWHTFQRVVWPDKSDSESEDW